MTSAGLAARFEGLYGRAPDGVWVAPGRVNLVGEHTDYNDGFVLPLALPVGVRCAAGRRCDSWWQVRSAQEPDRVHVHELDPTGMPGWAAYALGVVWALRRAGHRIGGIDLLVDGDVPAGAGLSSSAALECAVAVAVDELFELHLDRTALALAAQAAENDFVGAPTGAMDQMVSLHAQAGRLVLLDCRTLQVRQVPFDPTASGLALLVIDTRAPHRLVDSGYAARRRDCEDAARALGVPALRDVSIQSAPWPELPTRLQRRVRHVVTENDRVRQVAAALQAGDVRGIGPLLTTSHASMRDDFDITVPEVDTAVAAALDAGALGARMTGGGFGGCVIALVEEPAVGAVEAGVAAAFARGGFIAPTSFLALPSAGAHRVADTGRQM